MDFISQYLKYNSGNMSPQRYHMWSALSILAMTMSRKVYVDHEYYQIHPTMYICLVGRQGIRKSTAKDLAKQMFLEVFPDYPLGANVQSREDIVKQLAKDESSRSFTDEHGNQIEIKPVAFFINELKNFLSINPSGMIEFLTDIYDTKFFAASTIKHGLQPIINPCINILACETPKWIVEKMKLNIIAGGFSRRMIYVYETEAPERVTFPVKTKEAKEAEEWCKAHLQKISTLAGPFKWEPDARTFFDKWFRSLPRMEDEILEGFYEAKDGLALKVSMMVAIAQPEPRLLLTKDILQIGISILESIEDNLPKLTIAAGRNELAVPQQRILEVLKQKGRMTMSDWRELANKEMNEMEFLSSKRFFTETRQIVEAKWRENGVEESCVFSAAQVIKLKKEGKWGAPL